MNSEPLIVKHVPTSNKIGSAKRIYDKVIGWRKTDEVLHDAFTRYPKNNDPDSVYFKIELVDSLYKCNLRMDKTKIADLIAGKNLDMVNGDRIENVDKIAELEPGHKRVGWVFSSKYCHFHVPEKYPIIDAFARRGLKYLMENGTLVRYDSYGNFVTDLDYVILKIGKSVTYKDMDIYLYLLGQYLNHLKGRTNISSNIKVIFNDKKMSKLTSNLIP